MVRSGQKMLGIYLSIDLYNEIKTTASSLNKSMKDYLIDLHKANTYTTPLVSPTEQYQELQKQLQLIQQQLAVLTQSGVAGSRGSMQRTRATQKRSTKLDSAKTTPVPALVLNTAAVPDLQTFPIVMDFLNRFNSQPRQRQSLLDTITVLYAHGGQATSSIIKRERNLVRTTVAHKQIAVLVAADVVVENTSVSPRIVQFTALWMEQLGLARQ